MGQFLSRSQLPSRPLFRTPRDTERRVQISVVSADLQFARGAQADFVFEGVAVWFQQVLQGMKEGGQAYTDVLRRRQVDTCDPHRPTRSILQADRHTQMSFAVAKLRLATRTGQHSASCRMLHHGRSLLRAAESMVLPLQRARGPAAQCQRQVYKGSVGVADCCGVESAIGAK